MAAHDRDTRAQIVFGGGRSDGPGTTTQRRCRPRLSASPGGFSSRIQVYGGTTSRREQRLPAADPHHARTCVAITGPRAEDATGPRNFTRLWTASAVGDLGSYIRLLALQVLVVVALHGTAFDVGLLNAARQIPYLALGLVAGMAVDRWPRRSVLLVADCLMAAVYAALGFLAWRGHLDIAGLLLLTLAGGLFALFHDAAAQAFLPDLVPRRRLISANVRLEQGGAAAQTVGPAVAGILIGAVGAPLAVLFDATAHVTSASLIAGITRRGSDRRPSGQTARQEVRAGLHWIYRHPQLRPLALNTNLWFVFHASVTTVLVPFALLTLGLGAPAVGIVLAAAGVGAVAGTALSARAAHRWGAGRVIWLARCTYLPGIALLALAPASSPYAWTTAFGMAVGAEILYGLAMGLESPLETAYRQTVTPPHLQGRTNATMRATNRAMVVVAAPLSGALAVAVGYRPVLWGAVCGMALVALWFARTPMMRAGIDETADAE